MNLHVRIAVVIFTIVSCWSIAGAQQPAANTVQLEEEIAKLSVIDRNPSTPQEIRTLNHSFLDERKNRLRLLLEERITALQTYRRLVQLNANESRALDESLRAVENELRNLGEVSTDV